MKFPIKFIIPSLIKLLTKQITRIKVYGFSKLFYLKVYAFYPNVSLGKDVKVKGRIFLSFHRKAVVKIGNNVSFNNHVKYNFAGITKPVSICAASDSILIIGNDCGFSGSSIYCDDKIIIGDYCNFGVNTNIWDTDFHSIDHTKRRLGTEGKASKPIIIGNDVFVGANSIILKGVKIGDKSIIGAGSIVTKDIPEGEIWAGNPSRFIRKI